MDKQPYLPIEPTIKPRMHGVQESKPDTFGRVRFTLFWHGSEERPRRAQCFNADPARYPDVTWHPTEEAAKLAAYGS